MTACVNSNQKREGARRAVGATLAGVLAVGMVPAAAFADPAEEATEDGDGIEAQVAAVDNALTRGIITPSGLTENNDGTYSVQANGDGSALAIGATSVTPLGLSAITLPNDDYEVAIYEADEDGEPTGDALDEIVEPGEYVLTVTAVDGTYKGGVATLAFTVEAATLNASTVYAYEVAESGATTDKVFTYTGSELDVVFYDNNANRKLVEGTDYEIKILEEGTDNVASAPAVDVVEAGNYVGYMTGLGQYAGQTAEVHFTVNEFDLSEAIIEVDDVIDSESAPAHPTAVYYEDAKGTSTVYLDPELIDLTFVSGPSSSQLFDKAGAYTFSASYDSTNTSIEGAHDDITVNKVAKEATFEYDGGAWPSTITYDKSDKDSVAYNLSKVVVSDGTTDYNSTSGVFTEKVVDEDGNVQEGGSGWSTKPGTYTITITVDASKAGYAIGGSATITYKVTEGTIDADANVFVYYGGEATTGIEKSYDAQVIELSGFTAKAFTDEDAEITNASLTLALYDADGKPVDEAKDAGTYTLKVTSDAYDLTGTTEIQIVISKVDLSEIKVGALKTWYGSQGDEYLPMGATSWYWSTLDLRYDTGEAAAATDAAADGKGWDVLSSLEGGKYQADAYLKAEKWDEEKGEWVAVSNTDKFTSEGNYRIVLTGDKAMAKNYEFADMEAYTTTVEFQVVDENKLMFRDVTPGQWYFDVVADVVDAEYMNGYNGTSLFGPDDTITRGMVACVLYNMAGTSATIDENYYDETQGWTSYSDVDGNQYYGKAIAWAKVAGVVNGYGDGTFRPDQTITREEFAAMLANYAQKVNDYAAPEDAEAVLAELPDGDAVSGWATEVVAWAVSEEIMGNGGVINPQAEITRAEAAAMVANYAL